MRMNTIELKCVCNDGLGQKDAHIGQEAQDKRGISTYKNIQLNTCMVLFQIGISIIHFAAY